MKTEPVSILIQITVPDTLSNSLFPPGNRQATLFLAHALAWRLESAGLLKEGDLGTQNSFGEFNRAHIMLSVSDRDASLALVKESMQSFFPLPLCVISYYDPDEEIFRFYHGGPARDIVPGLTFAGIRAALEADTMKLKELMELQQALLSAIKNNEPPI